MSMSDNDRGYAFLTIAAFGIAAWIILEKIADTEKRVKRFFTKKRRLPWSKK